MTERINNETVNELYLIADELRAIANYGLMHTESTYEKERLDQVLSASARMIGILENQPPDAILSEYMDDMNHITPLIGAEAAVFKNDSLLLIKRHDDKLWAVPGGKTDIGETLKEAAVRELKEETGLEGNPKQLLGIFDSRIWKSRQKLHIYHVIFEVETGDISPQITKEALDWDFFTEDTLPELSPGHDRRVPFLFKLHRGEIETPFMD